AEEKNNLYTGLLSGQSSGSLDPTDTHDNDLAETYVDPSSGNFNYVEDGNAGKSGADISAMLSTLAVKFPEIDFTRDMHGDLIIKHTSAERAELVGVNLQIQCDVRNLSTYLIYAFSQRLLTNDACRIVSGTLDYPDHDKINISLSLFNSDGKDITDHFNNSVD